MEQSVNRSVGAALGVAAEGPPGDGSRQQGLQAEQAGESTSLEALARVGLVAYGLVHLLIGLAGAADCVECLGRQERRHVWKH
jgi:hypothetical protein